MTLQGRKTHLPQNRVGASDHGSQRVLGDVPVAVIEKPDLTKRLEPSDHAGVSLAKPFKFIGAVRDCQVLPKSCASGFWNTSPITR